MAMPYNQWVVSVVLSYVLPCLVCCFGSSFGKECPGKVRHGRRCCVQWTAMRGILRCTDCPPRSQCGLSSLQIVDFFLLLLTVASIRRCTARSASAGTGRLDSSFFVHISWCCPIGVCSSHVDFRHLNSAGSPYRVQHRSHPMLHGVVLTRCSELSSVAGSPHVPSSTAPLWFAHGHSLIISHLTLYW